MISKVARSHSVRRPVRKIVNYNIRKVRSISQGHDPRRLSKFPNENSADNSTDIDQRIDMTYEAIKNNKYVILATLMAGVSAYGCYKYYNNSASQTKASVTVQAVEKKEDDLELLLKHLYSEKPLSETSASTSTTSTSTRFKPVTKVDTKFKDIKGCDEVMQEMENLVSFLKNPSIFKTMGATLPKGVLMVGEPGVGKTSIARAVAGEAGVPFLYANASEIDDMYVGVGASRIRELFDAARLFAPCVVFIDEIEIIGSKRIHNPTRSNTAYQTLSQLMVEMDGYNQTEGILVLGATNNKETIDKALLRPGRFDLELTVQAPNFEGRKSLFNLYLSKVKADNIINYNELASGTVTFTGAKIKNMVNQATIMATLAGDSHVTMNHLWSARDQIMMGHKQKPLEDKETNRNTAVHEAGHALTAYYTPGSIPVHQVTIVPRNGSLGHTSYLEEKERHGVTKQELHARIDSMMGGRLAEELILGKDGVTTGAMSDLHSASQIAKDMVMKYGMSESVPHQYFNGNENREVAPETKNLLDKEVDKILRASKERVEKLLNLHKKDLLRLAAGLEEKHTLTKKDVDLLLSKKIGDVHSKPYIGHNSSNTNNGASLIPPDPFSSHMPTFF